MDQAYPISPQLINTRLLLIGYNRHFFGSSFQHSIKSHTERLESDLSFISRVPYLSEWANVGTGVLLRSLSHTEQQVKLEIDFVDFQVLSVVSLKLSHWSSGTHNRFYSKITLAKKVLILVLNCTFYPLARIFLTVKENVKTAIVLILYFVYVY